MVCLRFNPFRLFGEWFSSSPSRFENRKKSFLSKKEENVCTLQTRLKILREINIELHRDLQNEKTKATKAQLAAVELTSQLAGANAHIEQLNYEREELIEVNRRCTAQLIGFETTLRSAVEMDQRELQFSDFANNWSRHVHNPEIPSVGVITRTKDE
jgi:hypothetical protein